MKRLFHSLQNLSFMNIEEFPCFQEHALILASEENMSLRIYANISSPHGTNLLVHGRNLFSGDFEYGYIVKNFAELSKKNNKLYRTTKWFMVNATAVKNLVLSGTAHNRAIWQFKSRTGMITEVASAYSKYNISGDLSPDRTFSKVAIPCDAVAARVYYACYSDKDSQLLDDRLMIEYGALPSSYEPYYSKSISLPAYKDGYYFYKSGKWYQKSEESQTLLSISSLNLEVGSSIVLTSKYKVKLCVQYDEIEKDVIKHGAYGIRYSIFHRNPVCERIGDAAKLHYNAVVDNTFLGPYSNDFDFIYPWSDIRVCAVKTDMDGNRIITYPENGFFRRNGLDGNIMVEIPKFYCKREVKDGYEYLWISGEPLEGFELDPSFQTQNGELSHIYVGAYLSCIRNKKLYSFSDSYPLAKKSLKQIRTLIQNTGNIQECDLLAILTIQKLFMVETALLDSQSLFTGNVILPYLLKDKTTSYYALRSEKQTNRILVMDTVVSRRFRIGDSVSLLSNWREYSNLPDKFQRQITDIVKKEDNKLEIHFTGTPIDILERDTGITCIPNKSGETDVLTYHTGAISGDPGHYSFRYRYLENLWGTISILLESSTVCNNRLSITYPTGEIKTISYPLPVQKVQLTPQQFGDPSGMVIKQMGYDAENPLIMFPSEIGNGAFTNTYYCDAWYNSGESDVTYILTFGGAWDNKGYAGIFNFRASFTETSILPYNGSRLMLR